ncbi:MAG: prepilin-type N-terminal cleavage/methylation domain-containing protein [Woeseiaceae bacterium]|nr:prepilin-type N-terminal cleavage/methylation domain-containing protein [Woeseiaceae bacterium]
MRLERGFTLIEMMVAIGLTALLVGMAVPAMSSFVMNARQTGAINDFVSSIHLARNTAITTNARVTVCASASGNGCEAAAWDRGWVVFTDQNNNLLVDANDTIISTGAATEKLSILSGEFAQGLQYRANGRVLSATANGNSGQFTVCDDRGADYAKVVIVDLSGRPRLSKKLADGTPPACG